MADDGLVSAGLRVGAKGRIVIPATVRNAAGLAEGVTLVAHVERAGRVVLESRESIRDRVWAAAGTPRSDGSTALRAERDADVSLADAALERRLGDDALSDDRGQALLEFLGL